MKKAIKIVCAIVLALMAQGVVAAMNDSAVVFSTKGPDRYADGTEVLPGEVYALVWVREGHVFAGVDMNGAVVDAANSEILVALPLAKACKRGGGAHCPMTLFQIGADYVAAHQDGQFALVLLDTRTSNGAGELAPTGDRHRVNGWGFVEKSRIRVAETAGVAGRAVNGGEAVAQATSAIPEGAEIPQPKITSIRVEDGFAVLTVKGTSDRLLYNIAAGDKPDRQTNRHAALVGVQGHARPDREITIVTPVTEDQKFFKVVRN